jgi:tetratricopeptide (TPR) repeat protein
MQKHGILLILLVLSFHMVGQTLKEAQDAYNQQRYTDAVKMFQVLAKRMPYDARVNYGYGMSLAKTGQEEEAISYLKKAVNKKFYAAYGPLSELYFKNYYFQQAVNTIQAYLALPTISAADTKKYSALLIKAKLGADMIQHVESVTIVDSLQVDKKDFFKQYHCSKDLGTIFHSSDLFHQEPSDMLGYESQRGNRIIFADSLHGKAQLYSMFQMTDGWSDPTPLSSVVNDYGTALNDPFLASDGVTLYFAAKGDHSLGGYDLFITRYNLRDNSYFQPVNYGMPFNSIYNDYLLVVDDVNNIGWFATDRFQPTNKVMIYTFIPNAARTPIQSTDSDYIRRAAQLKTYKLGKMPTLHAPILIDTTLNTKTNNASNIQFVVNDTLTYSSPDQFKSPQARQLFLQADSLKKQIDQIETELENKRQAFAQAQTQNERLTLEPQIISLEQQVIGLRPKPLELLNNARDIENKALQESKK